MPLRVCNPYHAWQATKTLKNDGLFSDLPVSIILLCQQLSRMMTLPFHVTMTCMHACQLIKAINYPCMHVLLSLQSISFRDDDSSFDVELELLQAFGFCRCTWLSMCKQLLLQLQLLTIHKLIVFSIDDYLHTKLVYHSSVITWLWLILLAQ